MIAYLSRGRSGREQPDNAIPRQVRGAHGPAGLAKNPIIARRAVLLSLECLVQQSVEAGDHTLFVARVERVTVRADDRPLTSQDLDYIYVGEVVRRPR